MKVGQINRESIRRKYVSQGSSKVKINHESMRKKYVSQGSSELKNDYA